MGTWVRVRVPGVAALNNSRYVLVESVCLLVWGPDHQEEEASSISDDSEELASAVSPESQDTYPGDAGTEDR